MYRAGKEEIDAIAKVINSHSLFKVNDSLKESMLAEEELKAAMGSKHALIMTSGHAALVSALVALGVGPGNEVIVPAYTYIATAMAVVAAGAIPVIADVDETLTLCPDALERKITPRTKAVIPVHIQGFPCKMDRICEIAKKHGIFVVEDACQADGGSFNGKRLGTIGDAGAYSFNYFKIITTGEGGAMVTNDKKVFDNALIYHDSSAVAFFGNQLDDVTAPVFCGNEYRTHEIACAMLRVQLKRMDGILADLRKNKAAVMQALEGLARFTPSNDINGDCGTTLSFAFETEQAAIDFAQKTGGWRPIDTGKHVYTNWAPILQKRGALHPAMDPFKFKENEPCDQNYTLDMCSKTLDLLSRTIYLSVNPDWTKEQLAEQITRLREAFTA